MAELKNIVKAPAPGVFTAPQGLAISKGDFEAYERVRSSGVTNMYAINVVEDYSGLPREKIIAIMKNYAELNKAYPGVRKQ
jgi:hypothetical protein